ncbi:MAG: hypothetical protein O6763_02820 [Gammaproteobacteria bacterium]|nr:hypothetical protein [Gammaproteobacteria bacterium]
MLKVLLRYFAYATLIAGAAAGLLWVALRWPGGLLLNFVVGEEDTLGTSEFSPVEQLQHLLLLLSAGIFAWVAIRDRLRRPMCVGFIALFLIGFIRELDFFLDRYATDNLWQVLCTIVLALATVYIYRHRKRYLIGWRRTWPSVGLAIIFGGMLLLVPYSLIVGNESLWQAIMGDAYARVAKMAAEEFIELGGYLLIFIGSIEFLFTWVRLPETRSLDTRPRRRKRKRR